METATTTKPNYMNVEYFDRLADYSYEDYLEDCEENGVEPGKPDSPDFYSWESDMSDMEWDDFVANMQYSKFRDRPVIISGSLGRWNGHPTIYLVRENDPFDAIMRCLDNIDYWQIKMVDGVLNVRAMHHDGTNCYEIRLLTEKGIDVSNEWEDGQSYIEEFDSSWVTEFDGYLF